MLPGETLHSMLPWDIPWQLPDHVILFGMLYAVIGVLAVALGLVFLKTTLECVKKADKKTRPHR